MLVLERAAVHGGTSSMSGGHFYLGGGTVAARDRPSRLRRGRCTEFLMAVPRPGREEDPAVRRRLGAHLDWLEDLGFEFERSFYPEKNVISPAPRGLMYTSNEGLALPRQGGPRAARSQSARARGHREHQMVMDLLKERLAEAGVEVRYETGVTSLVTEVSPRAAPPSWAWRGKLRRDRRRAHARSCSPRAAS